MHVLSAQCTMHDAQSTTRCTLTPYALHRKQPPPIRPSSSPSRAGLRHLTPPHRVPFRVSSAPIRPCLVRSATAAMRPVRWPGARGSDWVGVGAAVQMRAVGVVGGGGRWESCGGDALLVRDCRGQIRLRSRDSKGGDRREHNLLYGRGDEAGEERRW